MRALQAFAVLLALALPLLSQEHLPNEHELGAYKGEDDSVRFIMNYCDSVDQSTRQQQPRIFAETKAASIASPDRIDSWTEFASRADWEAARKPTPLAFVWDQDNTIVRVTMVANAPRTETPAFAHQRLDYCYGTDTKLVRVRALWSAPTECEFLFPCRLLSNRDFFLMHPQTPAVTDWIFTEDGEIDKLRNGREVNDYFDPSNSLSVDDLHLKTSKDLPFNRPAVTSPK